MAVLEHRNQLLEFSLWPALYKDLRSAATFNVLQMFHVFNAQGHVMSTDFYCSLVLMTDGNGLRKLPDWQQQFTTMVREWRHIKMAKRAGRGHDPSGLEGTPKGSVAIPCRACPHPGINIPSEWKQASAAKAYKAHARANDYHDPALGPGWGVFVHQEEYMNKVKKHTSQNEISHCVGFSAIWNANHKKSKGLQATGVGAVTCACHELFHPNGMGDLQKGERYVHKHGLNTPHEPSRQFHTTAERPKEWQFPHERNVQFKVSKFHLQAHTEKCFAPYAFEYAEGVSEVDGKAPERTWAEHNEASSSLSMMLAGAQFDTSDDICNSWNWKKTIALDDTLLKKLIRGISNLVVYMRAFSVFMDALKEQHGRELVDWERMVHEWEQVMARGDSGKECPYDLPSSIITLAKVKKVLADEEHEREKKEENAEGTSTSAMLSEALDIKENHKSGQSQAVWTKMNTLRAQIDACIQGLRAMYTAVRRALLSLCGPGEWEKVLKVLNPEDIRGIGERFLQEEEKEEFCKAQKKSGVDQKDIEAVLLGRTSSLPLAYVNRDVVLTDAKVKNLLWIWYLSGKGDDNKELEASMYE
uniref:CxC2-like cysteine cluster KDZ transposase-associated domain-containing protein n=1 Tax=Moniliophthora roreri TaxID=221103 RepID=A0A0W0FPX6_MONRR